MQVGTGRSILNGIAIGKLKIYKKKDTVISTAEIADTAAEVARFEAAQQKAIEQQTALYEKALAEAGEDIAEVFNIHAMMLEDDDFVDAIKEIINGQHKCAEYAVKTAGDNQAAVFAAMDDPYLQARSADVIDIAQAILDILQGVDNASLQGTEPSTEPLGRAAHRRFVLYDVKRQLAGALLDVPFQTATLPAMILTGHVYASERGDMLRAVTSACFRKVWRRACNWRVRRYGRAS